MPKTIRRSVDIYEAIKAWYHIPMFVFHELAHILVLLVFVGTKHIEYEGHLFTRHRVGWILFYGLRIDFRDNNAPIPVILIASAPVWCWLLVYLLLLAYANFWIALAFYVIFFQFLSDNDVQSINNGIAKYKLQLEWKIRDLKLNLY